MESGASGSLRSVHFSDFPLWRGSVEAVAGNSSIDACPRRQGRSGQIRLGRVQEAASVAVSKVLFTRGRCWRVAEPMRRGSRQFQSGIPADVCPLIDNIGGSMASVPEEIQRRQIDHFTKADPEYGRRVAEGLGLRS